MTLRDMVLTLQARQIAELESKVEALTERLLELDACLRWEIVADASDLVR